MGRGGGGAPGSHIYKGEKAQAKTAKNRLGDFENERGTAKKKSIFDPQPGPHFIYITQNFHISNKSVHFVFTLCSLCVGQLIGNQLNALNVYFFPLYTRKKI